MPFWAKGKGVLGLHYKPEILRYAQDDGRATMITEMAA